MSRLHTIDITVTLAAPWLVHGNDPGRLGLDAVLMRDRAGQVLLPGTLLVGRIADAWHELRTHFGAHQLPHAEDWFGREARDFVPSHGRIYTNDLPCPKGSESGTATANRIQCNDDSGAVEPGMLMLAEQEHAPGQKVSFVGRWRAWLSEAEVAPLRTALLAGLLWQDQLGAMASVGLGEVLGATVDVKAVPLPPQPQAAAGGRTRRLALTFNGPLCVGVRGTAAGNLFDSTDIVPGAAIKAAMAEMWRHWRSYTGPLGDGNTPLAKAFDALRVSHAFPAADRQRRPGRLPLSLVVSRSGALLDAVQCPQAELPEGAAPRFSIDWKGEDWGRACASQGWGETRRELRVRTAISRTSRTAEEGKLFAYECNVAVGDTVWLADLALPDSVPQPEAVWKELEQLLAVGIGPIGKTAAWGDALLQDTAVLTADVWSADDLLTLPSSVVLQLQTPALLFAADAVAEQPSVDLLALYRSSFGELSGEALELQHFFASQALAGGEYLMRRYASKVPQRPQGQQRFLPYVLTQPGSVFVLNARAGRETDALKILRQWRQMGLPLPADARRVHGDGWSLNPFVPENGYGEVTVNANHGFPAVQPTAQEAA